MAILGIVGSLILSVKNENKFMILRILWERIGVGRGEKLVTNHSILFFQCL